MLCVQSQARVRVCRPQARPRPVASLCRQLPTSHRRPLPTRQPCTRPRSPATWSPAATPPEPTTSSLWMEGEEQGTQNLSRAQGGAGFAGKACNQDQRGPQCPCGPWLGSGGIEAPEQSASAGSGAQLPPSDSLSLPPRLFPPPSPALFPFLKNTEKMGLRSLHRLQNVAQPPQKRKCQRAVLMATPALPPRRPRPYGELRLPRLRGTQGQPWAAAGLLPPSAPRPGAGCEPRFWLPEVGPPTSLCLPFGSPEPGVGGCENRSKARAGSSPHPCERLHGTQKEPVPWPGRPGHCPSMSLSRLCARPAHTYQPAVWTPGFPGQWASP